MKMYGLILATSIVLAACHVTENDPVVEDAQQPMSELVNEYLLLELSMGLHDPDHVDAYYGPEELREQAASESLSLDAIDARATKLSQQFQELRSADMDEMEAARLDSLLMRLRALSGRIAIKRGEFLPFDEESERLFGAVSPQHDEQFFASLLESIDALVPGDGALADRVESFRKKFEIPEDRIEAVFEAGVEECRRRTQKYIALPEGENFRLEYVTDQPWGAYNWYQGHSQSLIQLNVSSHPSIAGVLGTGCHEGYPGHHVYNLLLEQQLVNERGWLEYTLYPLFSPESLIAEGSANYGLKLAFPDNERVDFERSVLFPLAGIDTAEADHYYQLQELMDKMSYAGNELARNYLDGKIDREQAIQWQIDYQLRTRERAERSLRFIEKYRSYVINYNLGEDLVKDYVERDTTTLAERWQKFEHMLSRPMLPQDLLRGN